MSLIWLLFLTFCKNLPWVAIGLMAALALRKRGQSNPLLLQALGAAAMMVLALGQWLVVDLMLHGLHAGNTLISAAHTVFSLLLFLALATFAVGYCLERLTNRQPAQVIATPA